MNYCYILSRCITLVIVFASSISLSAQYGFFESSIQVDNNGTTTTYDISGTSNTAFDGANLGTLPSASANLRLLGGIAKTFKEPAENVCEPKVYYAIYPTNNAPNNPFFDVLEIKFESEAPSGFGTSINQTWSTLDGNIDLTQYTPGDYTVELYYLFAGDNDTDFNCEDLIEVNNSNANFKANFTLSNPVFSNVTISPAAPMADGPITITFDATGTLLENESKVYFHSGIGIEESKANEFAIVKGNWGNDDGVGEMTSLGSNMWELVIPNIRTYYDAVNGEDIFGLNFLFRSADGSIAVTNGSINYFAAIDPGFFYSLESPAGASSIKEVGSVEDISAMAEIPVDWTLVELDLNGNIIRTVATESNATAFSNSYTVPDINTHYFRLDADNGTEVKSKLFNISGFLPVADMPRPSGLELGINYNPSDPTKATLVLHAPIRTEYKKGDGTLGGVGFTASKQVVHVIGDFNDWQVQEAYKMNRDRDGWDGTVDADADGDYGDYWWIELCDLEPGKPYVFQYLIDGEIRIGDPYTRQVSDTEDNNITANVFPNLVSYPYGQTSGRASVVETKQKDYVWELDGFVRPEKTELHIYELHFRDFTEEGTYLAAIERLDHIKQLGFNSIHVMPVSEFEGNNSWGYNPNYYFAADKAYGTENDLKKFIDEAHKRGIAVFNDVVLNHAFGSNPHALMYWDEENSRPTTDNPWFNAEHKSVFSQAGHWGNDWNHESQWTQQFIDDVIDYWLQEFRFDGFRFDFTKGISQQTPDPNDEWASNYNQERIDLLLRMTNGMTGRNPGSIVIFEHLANSAEDKALADQGILMWSGVGHHGDMKDLVLGFGGSDVFSSGVYNAPGRNFNDPHWISYSESHDEERLAYEIMNFANVVKDIADPTAKLNETIERLKIGLAYNLMFEGPRMMWEFQEFGYDFSINFNGRTGVKPVAWTLGYDQDPIRQELSFLVSQLLNARLEEDFDSYNYDNLGNPTETVKRMVVSNSTTGREIIIIANLDAVNGQDLFPQYAGTGTYYRNNGDDFKNDAFTVSNTGSNYFLDPGRVLVLSNFELPEVVIEDQDGDGIYDSDDTCVDVPGHAKLDGCPNSVTLAVDKNSLTEGDSITITATMQVPLNEDVEIQLSYAGDATIDTDFENLPSILIPACFTEGTIRLKTVDDGESESTENLTITAGSVSQAVLSAPFSEAVMINDNDCVNVSCPDSFPWNN